MEFVPGDVTDRLEFDGACLVAEGKIALLVFVLQRLQVSAVCQPRAVGGCVHTAIVEKRTTLFARSV